MATLNFGNYSSSEVDTGFTWIDGRHIYKRTVAVSFPSVTAGVEQSVDVFGPLSVVLSYNGYLTRSGDGGVQAIPGAIGERGLFSVSVWGNRAWLYSVGINQSRSGYVNFTYVK